MASIVKRPRSTAFENRDDIVRCCGLELPVAEKELEVCFNCGREWEEYCGEIHEKPGSLDPKHKYSRREMAWTTADKRQIKIKIKDLDDTHLGSILRLLDRAKTKAPIYEHLIQEIRHRNLLWKPRLDMGCSFLKDDQPCGAEMVMWTCDLKQEPRCQDHRPDSHAYHKKECAGCFKVKPLWEDSGGHLYCDECATTPGNPIYDALLAFCVWLAMALNPFYRASHGLR